MIRVKTKRRAVKLRKRYKANPTKANLRAWLRVRAARGRFDPRMFNYYNVNGFVVRHAKNAVRRGYIYGLVPTSTLRFPVGAGSYHNARDAEGRGKGLDQGLIESEINTTKGRNRLVRYQRAEFNAWQRGKRPNMMELIGPDNNLVVLKGQHAPLREGDPLENQHDNHVHQGWAA